MKSLKQQSITDSALIALRARNAVRVMAVIQRMGERWALHKANAPQKQGQP